MGRKIKRIEEIISVLYKYGFQDIISSKYVPNALKEVLLKKSKVKDTPREERILMAIEELGTTYIKIGQFLSMRPDLIPLDLCTQLKKLQDRVQKVDIDIETIFKKKLNINIHEEFKTFEVNPYAVASIGQVYKAELKNGNSVIFKVLKPNIKEKALLDLDIFDELISFFSKFDNKDFSLDDKKLVSIIRKQMTQEFNYETEANYIDRFTNNYGKYKGFKIPKLYRQYSCDEIICMEFIDGFKINDKEALKANDVNVELLVKNLVSFFIIQILEKGFYHADPHSGNILITYEESLITMIDYGMMGDFLPEDRTDIINFLRFVVEDNPKFFIKNLKKITSIKTNNIKELEYELHSIFVKLNSSLDSFNMSDFGNEVQQILSNYKINLPKEYYSLFKVLGMVEGLVRELYPKFNFIDEVKHKIYDIIGESNKPSNWFKKLKTNVLNAGYQLSSLPENILNTIEKIEHGELKINIDFSNIHETTERLEKMTNRISLTLIIVGLMVSSSLILSFEIKPLYHNISLIGLIGFCLAFIMSVWLMFTIIRKKKNGHF